MSASEFIELFVGLGASRVRELFKEAKKSAPAIVFIDEIDAVGRSRGAGLGGGNDEREQTLNQLLSEMDGFERNELVVVLAATNRPDVLDPALLRPGRFDRRILVDRPELAARKAILVVHSKGKPLAPDVDLQAVAESTAGFSGADLANLVNEAALAATRAKRDSIKAEDFTRAYDKIVLGDLRETKLDADEKKRVAIHESGHAVVARFSAGAEPPKRVSIIPRGMALGVTHQSPGVDRHIMTQAELEARLERPHGRLRRRASRAGQHLDGRRERSQGGDAARLAHGRQLRHEPAPRSRLLRSRRGASLPRPARRARRRHERGDRGRHRGGGEEAPRQGARRGDRASSRNIERCSTGFGRRSSIASRSSARISRRSSTAQSRRRRSRLRPGSQGSAVPSSIPRRGPEEPTTS